MELIDFIRSGLNVKRFHTVHTLNTNTVGHHSAGVALYCYLLRDRPPADLLAAALIHDLAEHETGDVPAPTKKQLNVKQTFDELENNLLKQVGLHIHLTPEDERTLKIADVLDGMSFCIEELRLGNSGVKDILGRYISYLKELKPWDIRETAVIEDVLDYKRRHHE